MPPFEQHSDAGDANDLFLATPATPLSNTTSPDAIDSGDASVAALADDLEYTLTVGEVVERIAAARRKPPSERSIQRYCIEGRLAAQKIRTIFGSEWLINESSLMQLIAAEPIVTGDAGVAISADMASPIESSHFIHRADTIDNGDASDATQTPMATPVGEKRTIAEVLIENARLLAQVEGRDAIITELKEDRIFLREEVREGRRTRDDVKNIAERMLDTLKTMAVGRSVLSSPPQDSTPATVINPDSRYEHGRG